MSQKKQLYSENERAFLLIHFNLNYGTDSLPYNMDICTLMCKFLQTEQLINLFDLSKLLTHFLRRVYNHRF